MGEDIGVGENVTVDVTVGIGVGEEHAQSHNTPAMDKIILSDRKYLR
jgi:hypothetical protein